MPLTDSLPRPAPSFDEPLEMLAACHDKLRRFCKMLTALPEHLKMHGADENAIDAARAILRYFDHAGPHHHQDEEDELFPLLRERDPGAAEALIRLHREHEVFVEQWQALRPALERVASGEAAELPAELVASYVGDYRAHIAFEEEWLFPLAAHLITPDELAAAGSRMAARRQARPF
ncbi:hemerythrin domain-containing protein [Crenobacter cavernae]|uniref:Hemerythrin domain-containing protein n=1 Tax=Crenobacter cavernae TaxID=2290923 RepID=A0A345Y5C5_9NEIS|nr:hemerythrin domain-containing protein [Crenobacter cavernae]AXK39127.1 hemerythrin domain-containing protein [Crenobacter cavernae]